MITFRANYDDVVRWFPEETDQFISELRTSTTKSSRVKVEKIEWVVSWGFFGKKAKNEEEQLGKQDKFMDKLKLVYTERLEVEIPKIRIFLSMKAGQYIRGDKIYVIPDFFKSMAGEVLKVMMFEEQKHLQDPVVLESLKEFEHLFKNEVEEEFNLDDILDKINTTGMESLTPQELKFLEDSSKG